MGNHTGGSKPAHSTRLGSPRQLPATTVFPPIRFKGTLRLSQRDVVDIVRAQLAAGERRFHVVAPPGSGKTVIGLHIWAELVRWLTSLTYQSVTIPRRGGDDLDAQAVELWQFIIEKGQAKDPVVAQVWIEDLRRHNRAYFEQRLAAYRKEVRDAAARGSRGRPCPSSSG